MIKDYTDELIEEYDISEDVELTESGELQHTLNDCYDIVVDKANKAVHEDYYAEGKPVTVDHCACYKENEKNKELSLERWNALVSKGKKPKEILAHDALEVALAATHQNDNTVPTDTAELIKLEDFRWTTGLSVKASTAWVTNPSNTKDGSFYCFLLVEKARLPVVPTKYVPLKIVRVCFKEKLTLVKNFRGFDQNGELVADTKMPTLLDYVTTPEKGSSEYDSLAYTSICGLSTKNKNKTMTICCPNKEKTDKYPDCQKVFTRTLQSIYGYAYGTHLEDGSKRSLEQICFCDSCRSIFSKDLAQQKQLTQPITADQETVGVSPFNTTVHLEDNVKNLYSDKWALLDEKLWKDGEVGGVPNYKLIARLNFGKHTSTSSSHWNPSLNNHKSVTALAKALEEKANGDGGKMYNINNLSASSVMILRWKCDIKKHSKRTAAPAKNVVRREYACELCTEARSRARSFGEKFIEGLVIYMNECWKLDLTDISHTRLITTPDKSERNLDIYFEYNNQKIGIEYDGKLWHKDTERDRHKDELCAENAIKLIRIREPGCPEYAGTMATKVTLANPISRPTYNLGSFNNNAVLTDIKKIVEAICKAINFEISNVNIDELFAAALPDTLAHVKSQSEILEFRLPYTGYAYVKDHRSKAKYMPDKAALRIKERLAKLRSFDSSCKCFINGVEVEYAEIGADQMRAAWKKANINAPKKSDKTVMRIEYRLPAEAREGKSVKKDGKLLYKIAGIFKVTMVYGTDNAQEPEDIVEQQVAEEKAEAEQAKQKQATESLDYLNEGYNYTDTLIYDIISLNRKK